MKLSVHELSFIDLKKRNILKPVIILKLKYKFKKTEIKDKQPVVIDELFDRKMYFLLQSVLV